MNVQPVALERRHERLDALAYVGRKPDIRHGKQDDRRDNHAEGAVLIPPFEEKVKDYDGPGRERHRLEQVGDRYVPDVRAYLVGLVPPITEVYGMYRKAHRGKDRADKPYRPVLGYHVYKVHDECEQVEYAGNLEEYYIIIELHPCTLRASGADVAEPGPFVLT